MFYIRIYRIEFFTASIEMFYLEAGVQIVIEDETRNDDVSADFDSVSV